LDDEFIAAHGVFEGDGHLCWSFKNPGNDEVKSCGIGQLGWKILIRELVLGFHW
jgi:hypothetical protein